MVSPLAIKGDRIYAIEGCGAQVVLRPIASGFEYVGLASVSDVHYGDKVSKSREGVFETILKLW